MPSAPPQSPAAAVQARRESAGQSFVWRGGGGSARGRGGDDVASFLLFALVFSLLLQDSLSLCRFARTLAPFARGREQGEGGLRQRERVQEGDLFWDKIAGLTQLSQCSEANGIRADPTVVQLHAEPSDHRQRRRDRKELVLFVM